jgi:hypothetical protein
MQLCIGLRIRFVLATTLLLAGLMVGAGQLVEAIIR